MIELSQDVSNLSLVHTACFAEGWSAASIAGLLSQPGVFALKAKGAGFVLVRVAADEAEIVTVCVLSGLRGQGLGRRLMHAAAEKAASQGATALFLEVAEDNEAAKAMYAALGFLQVGKRKAYYSGGSTSGDALVMRRDLPLEPLGNFFQTD